MRKLLQCLQQTVDHDLAAVISPHGVGSDSHQKCSRSGCCSGAAVIGGEDLSADLDANDLPAVVVPTLRAGAVRLIAKVVTLRAIVQLR